jgi:hypothetical protein
MAVSPHLRGRTGTYTSLVLSIVITFLAGLVVPFAFGSEPTARTAADRPAIAFDPASADAVDGATGDAVEGLPDLTADPSSDQTEDLGDGAATTPADAGTAGAGGSADAAQADGAEGAEGAADGGTPDPAAAPAPAAAPPAGPDGTPAGDGGTRTASDTGITPETVKVGFFTASFSQLARLGYGLDLGDEEGAYRAYIERINRDGGVHGRRIEPVFIPFDPADADDRRRACLRATQDEEVFAAVNLVGMFGAGALCVAEEHGTPLLAFLGESDSLHARAAGRYTSFQMSKDTALATMVLESHRLGLLRGRTIGVLDSEFPSDKEASESGLLGTLAALGYEVAHRHTVATNVGEAQAQTPVAVSEMQRKGVDVVFLAANFVGAQAFVNQAANRRYFPQYLASDFGQIATDNGTVRFDARAFDGAIGFSMLRSHGLKAGLQPNQLEQDCADRLAEGSGERVDPLSPRYPVVSVQCGLVDSLVRALHDAGPEPTRERFTAAQQRFGAFQIATLHPLSWESGKVNGGDHIWTVQWQADRGCPGGASGCWYPVDEVRRRPAR